MTFEWWVSICKGVFMGMGFLKNKTSIGILCLLFSMPLQAADLLAFPGAEGFGRFTLGARAVSSPEIYHVTNLNDSGVGSFRDAVSKAGRIVVFDVSGIINLKSTLIFSGNSIIAGQTAPGDGIMLYGDRVSFSGANNLIVRYLRIRMGINGSSGKDAAGVANGKNMIFDHVSVTWGRDETFSISWDSKGTEPSNITIQNSIIGQGLQTHSCGGLMQTDGGVTLFRNLYIDNKTRNPKVKGLNQFVNNVIYNWGGGGGYIMGGSAGDSWASIEDNYFIKGPSTGGTEAFVRATETFQVFPKNNYLDYSLDGVLNGTIADESVYSGATIVSSYSGFSNSPQLHPTITAQTSAAEAYKIIVEDVGASYPARDEVDTYLINELKSLGSKGALISNESALGLSGNVGTLASGTAPTDTDKDGIPDSWEDQMGLNKNNASDAITKDASGYLYIEKYINGLVEKTTNPSLSAKGSSSQTIALGETISSITYTFANCTGAQVTGLPKGVTSNLNAAQKTLSISGTPSELGTFQFTVTTSGGEGNAATLSGSITVTKAVPVVTPVAILSNLNAANPVEGVGVYEEKNTGYVDNGYYNFSNLIESYGLWKISSNTSGEAILSLRFANAGTTSRGMTLSINDSLIGIISFPSTASWTSWDSISVKVPLKSGVNTIYLESITNDGGPNIDQFGFNIDGVILWDGITRIPNIKNSNKTFTYNIHSGVIQSAQDGIMEVNVFDLQGKRILSKKLSIMQGTTMFSLEKENLSLGSYLVQIRLNHKNVSIFKWTQMK